MSDLIAALEARRDRLKRLSKLTVTVEDEAAYTPDILLLDLAIAAERRRQAREAFKHRDHESPDKYLIEVVLVGELALAQDAEDEALAALSRHLLIDATTAQDGAADHA